jgi:parvulin-like peptidyl-prolyl isomerase
MRRAAVWLAALIACSNGTKPQPIATGPLPEGVVARVGTTEIGADLVARVARAQHITPHAAAEMLADDALAARGATDRGLDRDSDTAWRLRALRGRFVVDRMREESKAKGPPTDAEIEELTLAHWVEIDSPEQRKVIHVVVQKPAASGAAVPVAEALLEAVRGAKDDTDFEARANAVPANGLKVTVERLPNFVSDGRIAMAGAAGGMDATFASAAFAIRSVGDTSPIVETSFGWHVIRLVEIIAPHSLPLAQRRTLLGPEVLARRAKEHHDQVIAQLRTKVTIDISTSAEQSMKAVKIQPPDEGHSGNDPK